MVFLFGKQQTVQARAETLEDGRALANEEMKKPKYREYSGAELMIEVAVRVQVTYEAGKHDRVKFDDQAQAILERNLQLMETA